MRKIAIACLTLAVPAIFTFAGIRVERHVLDNGLIVLFYPSGQGSTVACRLFYTTGSVHEGPGNTGIAHMLEHMLFKGTKKVGVTDSTADAGYIRQIDKIRDSLRLQAVMSDSQHISSLRDRYDSLLKLERRLFIKDELWGAYLQAGGTGLNAFTSDLMTAYFVTLPKNKLELFLWLEADRMQHAVLREFYPERDVVMEERRMRYEDTPLGRYWETLSGIFYEAHPYRQPTIGYASDIRHYTREMAEEHYRKYYKPNNAILVLAGEFVPKQALALVKQYFGSIPKGVKLEDVITREPDQVGEKRLTLHKDKAKPRYDLLFHTPEIGHDEVYFLDIVEGVLSGKSGRLHRKLVKDKKIAVTATASNAVNKYHSSFQISVGLGPEPKPEQVEKVVWEILDELQREPISSRELQRVKNQVRARTLRNLRQMEHLATQLAFFEMWGTWEYVNIFPESVAKVTANQVLQVCQKTFHKAKSTVGLVLPEVKFENDKP